VDTTLGVNYVQNFDFNIDLELEYVNDVAFVIIKAK